MITEDKIQELTGKDIFYTEDLCAINGTKYKNIWIEWNTGDIIPNDHNLIRSISIIKELDDWGKSYPHMKFNPIRLSISGDFDKDCEVKEYDLFLDIYYIDNEAIEDYDYPLGDESFDKICYKRYCYINNNDNMEMFNKVKELLSKLQVVNLKDLELKLFSLKFELF